MTHSQSIMALPAVYAVDLITPLNTAEHDMNNIMKKMSINPHQSQQNNLYQ